jgi:integrase
MAVTDLWVGADKAPTQRYGRGLRWRVTLPGHPSKAFRTKTEAEHHDAQLKVNGPARPKSEQTISPLLDRWLAGKAHLSKGGLSACRSGAGHARARWGDVLVDDVKQHEVQAWISSLSYTRKNLVIPASHDLRSKSLSALSGALEIARQHGQLELNPCKGVKIGRAERRDARFLTVDELGQLAAACGPYASMAWMLGTTGVRVGECCNLNVGDVDARRRRARPRKTKGGKPRDVPIPPDVFDMLDLDRPRTAPLFLSPGGLRVNTRNWRNRVFKPAAKAAGFDGLHVHDLRHTAASLMILTGATIKDVQKVLGHKSAAMTMDLYGHWWDDALDDVAARMQLLLTAAKTGTPTEGLS